MSVTSIYRMETKTSSNAKFLMAEMAVKDDCTLGITKRDHRKRAELGRILVKEEVQARIKLVTNILKKDDVDRSIDDQHLLDQSPEIVCQVSRRLEKRDTIKERAKEVEDREPILHDKCAELADAIRQAQRVVVYTGAGISTAASIPDYRGPNGIWTLLQKGLPLGCHNLSDAEPTVTHMALAELRRRRRIAYVVSQNCDGLHLRSGLPRSSLSELHGNMFIEVCKGCKPHREYVRLFDVTERTSLHRHKTGRQCDECGYDLIDTIVHFGEKGTLKSPLNWSKAIAAAKKCDVILCIGTSLKVLRKYTCLWGASRPIQERPKLYIVNLQWTPKDHVATLKINGRCDEVMMKVMKRLKLEIPSYSRQDDPLLNLAIPVTESPSTDVDAEVTKDESRTSLEDTSTTTTTHVCASSSSGSSSGGGQTSSLFDDAENLSDIKCSKDDCEIASNFEVVPIESDESKDGADVSPSASSSTHGWFGKGYRKNMKRRKRH